MRECQCKSVQAFELQTTVVAVAAIAISAGICGTAATAKTAGKVFTIANYPVEASAKNAVAAKKAALEDGRRAAFRSLLKRIVPVTAYNRLRELKAIDPRPFIAGISVKSERNSRTRYIASLDYAFSAKAVRDELRRQAIPFVDRQAPETVLVTAFNGAKPGTPGVTRDMTGPTGAKLWPSIWADLDLRNTLSPLKLQRSSPQIPPDTLAGVAAGDAGAMQNLASFLRAERIVLALAEPDPASRRLNVTIAGRDAVGPLVLKRRYRIDPDDFAYSLELAAVISLGIIEGRWKARNTTPSAAASGGLQEVQIWVEFRNLGEWNQRQRVLSELPGVEGMRTGGLSADGASVVLRYPGGAERLGAALANRGLQLEQYDGSWVLR